MTIQQSFSSLIGAMLIAFTVHAAEPTQLDVWPATAPGAPGNVGPEQWTATKAGGKPNKVTNVTKPNLTVFLPDKDKASGVAVIVCPGGGYSYVVYDKEGTEVAAWLNSHGVTALVLKYRVPNNREGALQDIQRALSLARAHAKEWNIDTKRLGVLGFSAGGNLAAKASTLYD